MIIKNIKANIFQKTGPNLTLCGFEPTCKYVCSYGDVGSDLF